MFTSSNAARRPRASLSASPSPQKCMNNRGGDSFNMWLCNAVTWMPLARSARRTGFTSLAIKTKSPVVAAPVAPVGWILIAVATPIAGGTSRLSTLTGPPARDADLVHATVDTPVCPDDQRDLGRIQTEGGC